MLASSGWRLGSGAVWVRVPGIPNAAGYASNPRREKHVFHSNMGQIPVLVVLRSLLNINNKRKEGRFTGEYKTAGRGPSERECSKREGVNGREGAEPDQHRSTPIG